MIEIIAAMTFTPPRRSWARGLAALLLGMSMAAIAQIPGLPPLVGQRDSVGAERSAPSKGESPEAKSRVDRLVQDFRADPARPLLPAPPGIADTETALERDVLLTLTHLNDRRSYAEAELDRLKKARADAEAADRSWTGLATPSPYSILQIDEWRDDADILKAHIASLEAALRHLDGELERAQAEAPMRAAAEKIEECAKRHGNVLKDPPPQVLFEDFGDSAQILTLYFWVEVSDKVGATQVASDLRFIIDKTLADDGVVIAFPQRDVRVDPSRPIRVEMVAGAVESKGAARERTP